MTNYDAQLDKLNQHFDAIKAQSDKVHTKTVDFINNSSAHAGDLMKAGKYQEAHDVMSAMMDGVQAKNKIINDAFIQRAENTRRIFNTPASAPHNIPKNPNSKRHC